MANTTNFNWETPDDTDLVKDGAAAMRTLGNSIDTSFVDLKGGTTGQILSKASNTDLDYTWVTTDDANAIQNAIVDAKGDIIAATANDTPARLAVGSDFAFLQADSSTATGLAWNAGAWTTYTPVATPSAGSITTYTSSGRYQRIGKTCIVAFKVNITAIGTATGDLFVSLPFTSANPGTFGWIGVGRENSLTGSELQVICNENQASAFLKTYNNVTALVNNYDVRCSLVYEVA